MGGSLRVGLLGPLVLVGAETPRPRQQRLVLAALAAAIPRGVAPEVLAEGLWPREGPVDARKALQVLVARLRHGLAGSGADIVLHLDGYRLLIEPAAVDAIEFRQLCRREQELGEDLLQDRLAIIERALGLIRGEPLADLCDEPLLAATTTELQLLVEATQARAHQLRLRLGYGPALLGELTMWAADRPLDSAAWCRLAEALSQAGRVADALRALQAHRVALRDTTGLQPSADVVALEATLLGVGGDRRVAGAEGNLRPPRRSVFGRDRDVARLDEMAREGHVCLVGPAGVGKTTLALQTGWRARHRFRDGVWFCDLAVLQSGDRVVEALAETLGIRQQRGLSLLDSIAGAFREAQALLVLDNCEHVLDRAALLVSFLRKRCESLALMTTSRVPVEAGDATMYRVDPLQVDDASGAAVDLFIERAREAGYRGGGLDRTAAAGVCRQLDGLPLAIELAAARTRTMSLGDVQRHLEDRLHILVDQRADGPGRHRSLWHAIAWSHELLLPVEREVFDALAVFVGGFSIDAAAAVISRPSAEVEAAVWSLVDKSLVAFDETTGRYQQLETMRQFARERLLDDRRHAQLSDRHLRYYAGLAHMSATRLLGCDEPVAVATLNAELANLRVAHQHAVASRQANLAAGLVASLHDFAMWRQLFELSQWAEATVADPDVPRDHLPVLHATAGWGRCIVADFEAAVAHAEAGLAAERAGARECGWLHDVLAHVAYFSGDVATGLAHSDTEISRARDAGDPIRLSYVLADSGIHAELDGQRTQAAAQVEEALALAAASAQPTAISMAYLAKGFCAQPDDAETAIAWFQRAAALADTVDGRWTVPMARLQLSLLLALHGNPQEAVDLAHAQFAHFRRTGDQTRIRAVARWSIPALLELLPSDRWADLVSLEAATRDRPHVREPNAETAIAHSLAKIIDRLTPTVHKAAQRYGETLDDTSAFGLASELLRLATDENPRPDP